MVITIPDHVVEQVTDYAPLVGLCLAGAAGYLTVDATVLGLGSKVLDLPDKVNTHDTEGVLLFNVINLFWPALALVLAVWKIGAASSYLLLPTCWLYNWLAKPKPAPKSKEKP